MTADGTGIGSAGGTGNFANYDLAADWNSQDGNVTTAGTNGGASSYGAFDMSGNVREWNDLTGAAGSSRGFRGGTWNNLSSSLLSSSGRLSIDPANDYFSTGFRLAAPAAVPEPSTYAMALAGIVCGGFSMWRRRKRA